MITPPETAIIKERWIIPWTPILITLGLVVLLVVGLFAKIYGPYNTANFETADQKTAAEIARIIAVGKNKQFVFTAVPSALKMITLPTPPNSNNLDASTYAKFKPAESVSAEVVQNDVIFNFPLNGITYIGYLNQIKNPNEIYQITDELHQLTLSLNRQFNRPPLKDRIPGVVQMAPLDPILSGVEVLSVYPSIRAVDAYAAAEILSRINKDKQATYTKAAENIINRGIGYGLYGQSDADAAKSVVEQYFILYDIKHTSTTANSLVNTPH